MLNPAHPYYTSEDGTDLTPLLERITCNDNRLYQPLKYLFRAGRKPGVSKSQDLRKAAWWVDRLLKHYIEHGDFFWAHWPWRQAEVDHLLLSFYPSEAVSEAIKTLAGVPLLYSREEQKAAVNSTLGCIAKAIAIAEHDESYGQP